MTVTFNPFTGNLDFVGAGVPDPLTVDNLTVNQLLTANHIHGNIAGSVYIHVKNLDDDPLEKGAPFYISGTVGASDRVEVKRARADDPARGPAIGLIDTTLAVNGEGNGVLIGEIFNYDTDTPGWATNQPLYVSATGTITNTRPTTGYRQIIGYVGRVQQSTGTIIVAGGKKEAVAGSDTQIQYNDDGGFGASANLTWDDTAKELGVGGDINLDDGGTYTTTVQCVTPTANRTISLPDATGTVALVAGSSGQLISNQSGAYAGVSTLTTDSNGNITLRGRLTNSYNSIADNPAKRWTGTWFTGGTATTTKPHVLIEPTGTTSTAWSTSGTGFGVNAPSGFTGNLLDLQVNGTPVGTIGANGVLSFRAGGFTSIAIPSFGNWTFSGIVIGDSLKTKSQILFGSFNTTILIEDAANTLAQRLGANAQAFRVYDTFASSTDFHRIAIATARATLTNVSGASVTATGLIPAGAVVMGVTSKVTTALGTTNSTTGYKIGTASDNDRWGAITGTAAGTTSDNRNWTAGTIECFPAATNVIVTATGGNFDGTGVIYLSVQYMAGEAD